MPSSPQALLNQSALLLLRPCQPHWGLDHLKSLSCSKGLLDIPVFVQQDKPKAWNLTPPLGLQGSEEHLALALAAMPQPGLPPSLSKEDRCRRCVVVGNGGILHGSHLGSHIDQYDVIIRFVVQIPILELLLGAIQLFQEPPMTPDLLLILQNSLNWK